MLLRCVKMCVVYLFVCIHFHIIEHKTGTPQRKIGQGLLLEGPCIYVCIGSPLTAGLWYVEWQSRFASLSKYETMHTWMFERPTARCKKPHLWAARHEHTRSFEVPRCGYWHVVVCASISCSSFLLSSVWTEWVVIVQSVQRLATGWTVRRSNPGGGEIFRIRPDRPWGWPSLL
jgi:hypothetical protein